MLLYINIITITCLKPILMDVRFLKLKIRFNYNYLVFYFFFQLLTRFNLLFSQLLRLMFEYDAIDRNVKI